MKYESYYEPNEVSYEKPPTEAGEVMEWPDEAGDWKLVSTGETAKAVEFKGDSEMIVVYIDEEGPFFSIDFPNDKFEKL